MKKKKAAPVGRPTNYSPAIVRKACKYLEEYKELGEAIPSIAGLCRYLDRARSTLYLWRDNPDRPEFSDILMKIEENQEIVLLSNGLSGDFNPSIAKMILTKHGYSDKQEIDMRSGDGSMSPTADALKIARDKIEAELEE